jgi:hypothetical protein
VICIGNLGKISYAKLKITFENIKILGMVAARHAVHFVQHFGERRASQVFM